jgi:hypothetical protein
LRRAKNYEVITGIPFKDFYEMNVTDFSSENMSYKEHAFATNATPFP